MTITLSTSRAVGQTGHVNDHNVVHLCTNGLIFNDGAGTFWIPATSNSDATAGRLMRASARAAVNGVASLDGSGNLPLSQLPSGAIRNDQQNTVPLLNGLKLGTFSSVLPAALIYLQAARGTSASPTAVQSGDYIGALAAQGQFDTTIGDYGGGAVVRFKATENFAGSGGTATNAGTKIEFVVNANATGTTALLALTLDQDASATFAGTLAVTGASAFTGNVTAPNLMQTDGTVNIVTGASGLISNTSASGVILNGIRNTGALTATGTQLLLLRGQGATDGAGTIASGSSIALKADAAFAAGSSPGRIEFLTTPSASTTSLVRGGFNNAGLFFIGTAAAFAFVSIDQTGLTSWADTANLAFGTSTGSKIGTATTQKIGLWNATPVVQYSTTGTATGFTAGGGTTATHLSTFTGNSGTKAYTVGDIVLALKTCGIMAAS